MLNSFLIKVRFININLQINYMYVEREITEYFEKVADAYGIIAIIGPRQAGKTTFLKQKIANVGGEYLMLDEPDVKAIFDEDIKKFENQYLHDNVLTAIDEIQYGKEAGRKLKYLVDKGRKLWITSSSQIILSAEVLSWLVGRASIVRIYPFSLVEFMTAKNQRETTKGIIQRTIWEHVIYGGYPRVVLSENIELKSIMLKDLYETMVLKDVSKTFSITDIELLERLSRYLARSIGNTLVYDTVASDIKTTFHSLKRCLEAMEKSYLIILISPFFSNKLKELTKQPKIYFIDTGLRNAIINSFPVSLDNEGKLFENYICSELLKMGFTPKYWQTKSGAEVDFVIEKNGVLIPIEVKISANAETVGRSLRSFISEYSPKIAIVVSYKGSNGETRINGCKVVFTDVPGLRKLIME
jgi:predicted AAA+ superfamily ATPase